MGKRIPEVDAYIEAAQPFARPLLKRIRTLMHKGCPKLEETMRWSAPFFDFHGPLASMGAFKAHVSFSFWRGGDLGDPHAIFESVGNTKMCSVKWREKADLPDEQVLLAAIREAAALNESGEGTCRDPKARAAAKANPQPRRAAPRAPADLMSALKQAKGAKAHYDGFSPSKKREYVEWVTEAKTDATRAKRIAQAAEWIAEGKPRNWKYMKEWKGR